MLEERSRLRRLRDFTAADILRDQLREGGWEVVDSAEGSSLQATAVPPRPRQVTLLTVLHGWPEDAERWLGSILRHHAGLDFEALLVDNSGDPRVAEWAAERSGEQVRVLTLEPAGFGAAVNAGLKAAAGEVVILFDPGVEAEGDLARPLLRALERPGVGIAAAFGLRGVGTVKHFHEHPGPEVDAVEGYCMAFRRAQALEVGGFDERFRFYRIADIEFSFRLRSRGLQAVVVAGLPIRRHAHRLWEEKGEEERERLSRKNFYRFLDKWGKRTDLLVH
ncbi:MAG: glycosyltransferase [Chloroflexi bacterium]|nr:MAG: glycosyltransferase [Chloroflexota bacterium]